MSLVNQIIKATEDLDPTPGAVESQSSLDQYAVISSSEAVTVASSFQVLGSSTSRCISGFPAASRMPKRALNGQHRH